MLHSIDIVTRDNQPTGRLSNPEDANNHGLWHRGIHVALYTSSGKVLLEKRSKEIMYHPGMIDIGVGGYVDSGETPQQAAVREVKEETGLTIYIHKLQPVSVNRFNHAWRYGSRLKKSRVILYTFLYELEESDDIFVLQKSEVAWIKLVPLRSAQWLVHRHFLKKLGLLSTRYGYYRKLVRQLAAQISNNK